MGSYILLILGLVMFGALIDALKDFDMQGCYLATGSCPHPNVTFWLRTREQKDGLELSYDMLDSVPLVEDRPLVVLIHGYTGHKDYSPNMELVPAYLEHGGYNIISVDWGKLAEDGCYIQASFNVAVAGRCTAHFLGELYTRRGDSWRQRTHIVGFSLGAHVSGILGYFLGSKLPRITGLDPALPLFTSQTSYLQDRLDPSDAQYIDIYHTNAGLKGRVSPLGHVDFYINNGGSQPGCGTNSSCNHVRAVEIFAESINTRVGFIGQACTTRVSKFITGLSKEACTIDDSNEDRVLAGEHVNITVKGTYKITTNDKPPYAKGYYYENIPLKQIYLPINN